MGANWREDLTGEAAPTEGSRMSELPKGWELVEFPDFVFFKKVLVYASTSTVKLAFPFSISEPLMKRKLIRHYVDSLTPKKLRRNISISLLMMVISSLPFQVLLARWQ